MNKKIIVIVLVMLVSLGVVFFFFSSGVQRTEHTKATEVPAQKNENLTSEDAVALIKNINPDLADYPSDGLLPKRIAVRAFADGWNVGFLKEGTGRVGILNARCFQVSNSKRITVIGAYSAAQNPPNDIDLMTCTPKF